MARIKTTYYLEDEDGRLWNEKGVVTPRRKRTIDTPLFHIPIADSIAIKVFDIALNDAHQSGKRFVWK